MGCALCPATSVYAGFWLGPAMCYCSSLGGDSRRPERVPETTYIRSISGPELRAENDHGLVPRIVICIAERAFRRWARARPRAAHQSDHAFRMGRRTFPSYICVRWFVVRTCNVVLWLMGRRLGSCGTCSSGCVNQIDFGTRIQCRK